MDWKWFTIGLGVVAAITLIFYPEIKGLRQPQSAPAEAPRPAQDATAAPLTDEEISERKNYKPPDAWKWKHMNARQVCEPLWDAPWIISCHTPFEEPIGYPQPCQGGCRYDD